MPTTFITLVQRPDDEQHHDTDETEWLLCIFPNVWVGTRLADWKVSYEFLSQTHEPQK